MEINWKPTYKQHLLFEAFKDNKFLEIGFGGGVGGGKTFALLALIIFECLKHPGIRVGLARHTLTQIKNNTVPSFNKVITHLGISLDSFNYNSQTGRITFNNGSVIQFVELRYLPTDPDYTRLSGAEFTFAAIEEAQGCSLKGKTMLQSRVGRHLNNETGIGPKLLMTFNPDTNFLYQDFYLPWKNDEMPDYRKFIPAKLSDNKFQEEGYKRNLELTMDEASRSRLLDGEWDFDSDKTRLLNYQDVLDLYDFPEFYKPNGDYYISADIAFSGDKTIILLWRNLDLIKIYHYTGDEPEKEIIRIRDEFKVDPRKIVYDSDGVGKYIKGKLKYAYDFINNGKPLEGGNYDNIKSQVYFKLAENIKLGLVKVHDNLLKDELIQEVYEIKSIPLDTVEGKLKIIKKKEVVQTIGRSPDISDAMSYRMVFEIKKKVRRPFL